MQILKQFYHDATHRYVVFVGHKDKENYYYMEHEPKEEDMELIRKHAEA